VPPLSPLHKLPIGKHRGTCVCVHGVLRSMLALTPRLTFLGLQPLSEEGEEGAAATAQSNHATATAAAVSSVAASGGDRQLQHQQQATQHPLVQVVLKLNDGTGFTAAQQAACRAQLRIGQRICLHAFVEINAAAAMPARAAPPAAPVVPAQSWELRTVGALSATAASSSSTSSSASAAATSVLPNSAAAASAAPPPPAVDPRLTLHAISLHLSHEVSSDPSAAAAGTNWCGAQCAHTAAHSEHFAAALADFDAAQVATTAASASSHATAAPSSSAAAAVSPASSVAEDPLPGACSSLPSLFPDLSLAFQERRQQVAAAATATASAAAIAPCATDAVPAAERPLSLKEQQKKLNRERQRGEARKRPPKCNTNRGLKFFQFLEDTFGVTEMLQRGQLNNDDTNSSGSSSISSHIPVVLDIAGGAGVLAYEFSRRDLACTVVDPRAVDNGGAWAGRRARYLALRRTLASSEAAGGARPEPTFSQLQCLFDEKFLNDPLTKAAWDNACLVVGLHPDEATEPLVTLCLAAGKPFAVVPCCVFPSAHPRRRTRDGLHVRTHEQLCQYYLELDPSVQRATLDFEGRNTVLFSRGRQGGTIPATTSKAPFNAVQAPTSAAAAADNAQVFAPALSAAAGVDATVLSQA
jgi:hypothetical protein